MTDLRVVDLDDPNLRERITHILDIWDQHSVEPIEDCADAVLAVLRDTSHPANPDDVWTGLQRLREPR